MNKLIKDLQKYEHHEFIKKHKMTMVEFFTFHDCLLEILKTGKTATFISNVANVFKKYKFAVSPDEHNINYIIKKEGN